MYSPRLGAIQESNDGGRTWTVKWDINTGEYWTTDTLGYDVDINAADVLILDDDTAVVAVGAHQPVRRDPDSGMWTPRIADIRTVPWELILVAISFQLPAIGGIRRFRAGHDRGLFYLLGGVVVGLAGLAAVYDIVGPVAVVAGSVVLVILLALLVSWMSETKDRGSRPAVFSTPVGPMTALLLIATSVPLVAWAQDWLEWGIATKATWVISIASPLIVGFLGRPTTLASPIPEPQPAPLIPLAPSLDQPPPPAPPPEPSAVWSNRPATSVGIRLAVFMAVLSILVEIPSALIRNRFGQFSLARLSAMVIVLGLAVWAVAAIVKSGRQRPPSMPLRLALVALLLVPILFRYYIPPMGNLFHFLVLVGGVPLVIHFGKDQAGSSGTKLAAPLRPGPDGPPAPPGKDRQLHQ